jgi:hypothetical protein
MSEVSPLATGRGKRSEQSQGNYWQQGQQVKKNRSPSEKVFLDLEPEDRADLT